MSNNKSYDKVKREIQDSNLESNSSWVITEKIGKPKKNKLTPIISSKVISKIILNNIKINNISQNLSINQLKDSLTNILKVKIGIEGLSEFHAEENDDVLSVLDQYEASLKKDNLIPKKIYKANNELNQINFKIAKPFLNKDIKKTCDKQKPQKHEKYKNNNVLKKTKQKNTLLMGKINSIKAAAASKIDGKDKKVVTLEKEVKKSITIQDKPSKVLFDLIDTPVSELDENKYEDMLNKYGSIERDITKINLTEIAVKSSIKKAIELLFPSIMSELETSNNWHLLGQSLVHKTKDLEIFFGTTFSDLQIKLGEQSPNELRKTINNKTGLFTNIQNKQLFVAIVKTIEKIA